MELQHVGMNLLLFLVFINMISIFLLHEFRISKKNSWLKSRLKERIKNCSNMTLGLGIVVVLKKGVRIGIISFHYYNTRGRSWCVPEIVSFKISKSRSHAIKNLVCGFPSQIIDSVFLILISFLLKSKKIV